MAKHFANHVQIIGREGVSIYSKYIECAESQWQQQTFTLCTVSERNGRKEKERAQDKHESMKSQHNVKINKQLF